jgi:hypothetical protein
MSQFLRLRTPLSSAARDSEQSAEIAVAVSVHLCALVFGMARPSSDHVGSRDAATACWASRPAWKPPRGSRKMAEVAVFGVHVKHSYTSVNGVEKYK